MPVDLSQYGITTDGRKVHEEIIYVTALLYNVLNCDITTYLADYDLTPGKFNVLMALKHHGGDEGLPQVQIGRHLILTKSNMTKHLDKLEKEGLITRSAQPGDRRVKLVRTTRKADKLLERIRDDYHSRLKTLANHLTLEKQHKLSRLLTEWFGNLVGEAVV